MPNIPLTLALYVALLMTGVASLRLSGRRTPARPLIAGIGVVAMYWTVSPLGLWLQDKIALLADLHWNWLGKVLAIAVALVWWRLSSLSRADIGLTWRQRRGSVIPALLVIALACGFAWTVEALNADGPSLARERLLFQAIMPGLDEELVFRGLMFAFFSRAFDHERAASGETFGLAGLVITLLFAAGHALFVVDGAITVNWHTLFVTGTLGAALMWLRTRTGSLALPILLHNLSNFGDSFL